jgi:hypothetical protein
MPNPVMKSFAKQSGKKVKTVEKLWKKCEKLVKKEYDIDEESERFYPLVVGCLKNLLDIKKEDKEQKDVVTDAGMITTSNMGNYVYAKKAPELFRRTPDPKYTKIFKKLQEAFLEQDLYEDLDDVFSGMVQYYSEKSGNVDEIVEASINATAKYLKINLN